MTVCSRFGGANLIALFPMPLTAIVFLLSVVLALPAWAQDGAVLQGLDKVTARISTFEAPQDKPVRFGTLEVIVRTCSKTPPEEPPESTAFLEIFDARPGEERIKVFSGWMFASSPALSAMEHAIYDVWVVDCINASSSSDVRPG